MRILAHIHTFNDADIIDRTIGAVRRQTHPVDGILVVDNASTDGTLERPSLKKAAILRHQGNVGTSGAVITGFRYAIEQDYDWIWVFDADSTPDPDALEKLLRLYDELPKTVRDVTAFLACLPRDHRDGHPHHGQVFARHGIEIVTPPSEEGHYAINIAIWSGSLYRVAAIRRIGLPNPDYVLDWGETEYAYHVMKAGYKAFMHQDAVLRHNIRGAPSLKKKKFKYGPAKIVFFEFPAIRCYYMCRNAFYFVLYDAVEARFRLLSVYGVQMCLLAGTFLLRPLTHGKQIRACLRGIWHGLTGNIAARY
ncbi:MAG: glycosyltransferase [Methylocella sp.]